MGHIDTTKEIFAQFRDNDRPGPIHMLNLVRLRKEAAYPDGRKASGAEAYAAYGRESGPVFERLGGHTVMAIGRKCVADFHFGLGKRRKAKSNKRAGNRQPAERGRLCPFCG